MIKARILAAIAFFSALFAACDDNSETIGNSLTNNVDRFDVITDTFQVNTSSYIVDSVLSRTSTTYHNSLIRTASPVLTAKVRLLQTLAFYLFISTLL